MNYIPAILVQVLESTFEDFAFMFIETVSGEGIQNAQEETYVLAGINFFAAQETGRLKALASFNFCRHLSQNILGLDADETLSPGAAESSLCELANVACGLLTEALYGQEQLIDIQPPEFELCNGQAWQEFTQSKNNLQLLVDDQPVGFELQIWPKEDD